MSINNTSLARRMIEKTQYATKILLGIILSSFMTIVFIQTISRYVFNSSIWWSEELSRYLFIWLIMLGVNVAIYQSEMLRLEILEMFLSKKGKEILSIIVAIISLAAIVALLYCSILYFIDLGSNQIAPTLGIQMRYVVLCVPIGMALSIVTEVLIIIDHFQEFIALNRDRGVLTDVS